MGTVGLQPGIRIVRFAPFATNSGPTANHPKQPCPIMLAVGAVVRVSGFPDLRHPDPGLAPTDPQTDDPQLRCQRG